jgi:5-oxoprolinase (ATP-hydrolysing) subunit A
MLSIDLNCDMGEGYPYDDQIFPYINSVNIACGYHAGDKATMQRTVELALKNNVAIGAHPSYPDKENFGRIDILHKKVNLGELTRIVQKQIILLQEVCTSFGTQLHHVKPHGALYNRAAWDEEAAQAICSAIQQADAGLLLYGLSGSIMQKAAANHNLQFVHEVFADRSYQADGSLTPRSAANALINDTATALQQVLTMIREGQVNTITGQTIPIKAETICIHGDGAHAVAFAKAIYTSLRDNDITLKTHAKNEQR